MKTRHLLLLILGISINSFSQTITRDFQTDSGLYGKITFFAKPAGFSNDISINCQNISIDGIRNSQGHYSGSDLINYGIQFPINNAKGYFIVNGTAAVYIKQFARYGKFNGNNYVYDNIGGSYSVNFNENVKQLIKETNSLEKRNVWKETARVVSDQVNVRAVNVSDRYGINDAIKKLEKDKQNTKQYANLMSNIRYNTSNEEKLNILNQAKKYASNSQLNELQSRINKTKDDIKQQNIKEEEERIATSNRNKEEQIRKQKFDEEKRKRDAKYAETSRNLGKSWENGHNLVEQMRNEANSMQPRYQFELEYKRDLLKRANEYEQSLIKQQDELTFINGNGVDSNTNYSNTNASVYSNKNAKLQRNVAIANAGIAVLGELLKTNPENQARRKEWDRQRKADIEKTQEAKDMREKEQVMSDYSTNGLAVKKNKKGWYGFIDSNGKWIIKAKYMDAKPFINGKALVKNKIGQEFYINIKGKKI